MKNYVDWVPADGLTLEPNALRAATETSRCLVLTAGPGAGKTEMLAQRADFLLRMGVCRYPRRILAISFKADARRNLKERVRRRCGSSLSARFDSLTFHAFAKRLIDQFRPLLTGTDALDPDYTIGTDRIARKQIAFADMVPLALEILGRSLLAANVVRQTYSDVFLDEFQDCTDEQYSLLVRVFRGTSARLTAVGDTKQRIMAWAGALEGIFARFKKDFEAHALNLYLNFRSKPRLLRLQNEIIRTLDPSSVMPPEQIKGDEGLVENLVFEDDQAEAVGISEMIRSIIGTGTSEPKEIAVLVSKQAELYAAPLMREFERLQIPYRNEQKVQDLLADPLPAFVVDYLKVIYGEREPDSYGRLRHQFDDWSGGDEATFNWDRFIADARRTVRDHPPPRRKNFSALWNQVRQLMRAVGTERLVSLSADYESKDRLAEITSQLGLYLREAIRRHRTVPNALAAIDADRAVRIMTIHKSKGLEFDNVFILGVESESFWGETDEERCVFFVAVSRAKRRLVLTSTLRRARPEGFAGRWNITRSQHQEFLNYAKGLV